MTSGLRERDEFFVGIALVGGQRAPGVRGPRPAHRRDEPGDRIGIIDCSGTGGGSLIETMTESTSSPGDLTGISIGTAKLAKRFHSRGISDIRYGLVSISTLLQYVDKSTVFRFLHVFTNRVSETDGLGVYTLNDDAHDATTVNTIRGQFDDVVELRELDDGTQECRVRGLGSAPSGWNVFE